MPRPVLDPTDLLFIAAAVLDIGPVGALVSQAEDDHATVITLQCEGDLGSRRNKRSPAEEAIVKLSDKIILALE